MTIPSVDQATANVINDVMFERMRQDAKFPGQVLPDGVSPDRITADLERAAKLAVETNDRQGTLTWVDVVREEWYELLNAATPEHRREEAIQVAAVVVRWVEDMDKRT